MVVMDGFHGKPYLSIAIYGFRIWVLGATGLATVNGDGLTILFFFRGGGVKHVQTAWWIRSWHQFPKSYHCIIFLRRFKNIETMLLN